MKEKVESECRENKVMVFERAREQAINFAKAYRVGSEAILGCKIWLGKEKMEEVNEFKYLRTILCKHGSMEGEVRERTVMGRQVIDAVERVMKGRNTVVYLSYDHNPFQNWGRNSKNGRSAKQKKIFFFFFFLC